MKSSITPIKYDDINKISGLPLRLLAHIDKEQNTHTLTHNIAVSPPSSSSFWYACSPDISKRFNFPGGGLVIWFHGAFSSGTASQALAACSLVRILFLSQAGGGGGGRWLRSLLSLSLSSSSSKRHATLACNNLPIAASFFGLPVVVLWLETPEKASGIMFLYYSEDFLTFS